MPHLIPTLRRALALLAALTVVTASGCALPLEKGDRPTLLIPKEPSAGKLVEDEAVAYAAWQAKRYDDAGDVYFDLARTSTDARLRAEFLLYAAEGALGSQDHFAAYLRYTRLLKLYANTPHYDHVVARQFLTARLFAEGKAIKPSWLLGIDMTDREFGVKALERFQRERERHPQADDALHYAAEGYEAEGEPDLAIQTWTRLGRLYPNSEWAETAEFRTALATLALTDGVDYDKGPMRASLARLDAYLRAHDKGNHAKEARIKRAELQEKLAQQMLEVADYYHGKDRYYAARLYLAAIQRDYPKTNAASEAKEIASTIPRTSPPPPPPAPDDLKAAQGIDEDRLRIAPPPVDDAW